VEEPTIEDRVELRPETGQVQGVGHLEPGLERTLLRFLPGPGDGEGGGINTQDGQTGRRRHEGVFARTAAHVEDVAPDLAGLEEAHEGRLGSADVPRGDPRLVGGVEILVPPGPTEPRVHHLAVVDVTVIGHGLFYHPGLR
jgi:hypothetical protein